MRPLGRFLGLVCLAAGIAGGHLLYLYNHREFGPKDFSYPFVLQLPASKAPDEAARQQASNILEQKFIYLGCGTQMTAYESEDRRYVIKFFNPRNIIKKEWFYKKTRLRRMSSPKWIMNAYFKKKERLLKFFKRYEMAFQDLRDESGLIYVHLNGSTSMPQKLKLVDKEGKSHQIDLAACPFVLQEKVELAMAHLDGLLGKGAIEQAKRDVKQIYDLFLSRTKKGYTDKLQTLDKNYGFAGGRAVQLDVGRIRQDEAARRSPLKEMERIVVNISPSLPPELSAALNECLENNKQGSR